MKKAFSIALCILATLLGMQRAWGMQAQEITWPEINKKITAYFSVMFSEIWSNQLGKKEKAAQQRQEAQKLERELTSQLPKVHRPQKQLVCQSDEREINPAAHIIQRSHTVNFLIPGAQVGKANATSTVARYLTHALPAAQRLLKKLPETLLTTDFCFHIHLSNKVNRILGFYHLFAHEALYSPQIKSTITSFWTDVANVTTPTVWSTPVTGDTDILVQLLRYFKNYEQSKFATPLAFVPLVSHIAISKKAASNYISHLLGEPDILPDTHYASYLQNAQKMLTALLQKHSNIVTDDALHAFATTLQAIEETVNREALQKASESILELLYTNTDAENFVHVVEHGETPLDVSATMRAFFIRKQLESLYYSVSALEEKLRPQPS